MHRKTVNAAAAQRRQLRFAVASAVAIVLSFGVGRALAQDGKLGDLIPTMSMAHYAPDSGPEYQESARIVAEGFKKLGLDIRLQPMQQSSMVAQLHVGGGLQDLALGSWGGDPDRLDPNFWILSLSACGSKRNAVKWCDEAYTKLAKKQARTMNEDKRQKIVWEAQKYFQDHAPWWQVSNRSNGILYNNKRWKDVTKPSPIPPHETVLHPWLTMKPLTDDRIVDWAYFEDVSTYNPLAEQTSAGWLRFIYDPYVRFDGGNVVPWAAKSWKTIDDTTLEVTLRSGMTFHDGKPLTAEDAVFSLNLMVKLQPPVIAGALTGIQSAEKVDDLTFRIHMTEPNPAIIRQGLTNLVILPKHIWKDIKNPLTWDPVEAHAVIGSGPFKFVSWDRNQSHVLATNKAHWAAPDYDGIRRLSLGQADAIRAAMVDGTADIATFTLPVATMQQLGKSTEHLTFIESPSFSTTTVWMNTKKAPFNDVAFRKALRLATDKERASLEGWLGFARVAGEGNVPKALGKWYNSDLKPIPFDIKQARQVLKNAGYGWDSNGRLHFPLASK